MSYNSPYSRKHLIGRIIWKVMWKVFTFIFPRSSGMSVKRLLVNAWGGQISNTAIIYSTAKIFAPWNLEMGAHSCIGPDTDIYNAAKIVIKENAIVSQYAYLCTATHNIRDIDFSLYSIPIVLEKDCWVSAKCFIGPGVTIGEGAVVGATASVYRDVPAWSVVGGNPATIINRRILRDE